MYSVQRKVGLDFFPDQRQPACAPAGAALTPERGGARAAAGTLQVAHAGLQGRGKAMRDAQQRRLAQLHAQPELCVCES